MKKNQISPKNQAILDTIKQKGIDAAELANHYGIQFVLGMFLQVRESNYRIPLLWLNKPRNKDKKLNPNRFNQLFEQRLGQAGFTFYRFTEDFVDEDTGKVVSIRRKGITCEPF